MNSVEYETIQILHKEIARLRAALAIFSDEDNWKQLSIDGSHEGWIWDHEGISTSPFTFAKQILDDK